MGTRRRFVLTGLVGFVLATGPVLAAPEHAELLVGEVVAGVDFWGRVLVAVDAIPTDGVADRFFIYTADERLAGPWSRRLETAQVFHNQRKGALAVISADRSFLLSVAVHEPIDPPHPAHAEVFSHLGGIELAAMKAGNLPVSLENLSMTSLSSWPEGFWYDVLAPESGPCSPDGDCMAGGQGSDSCSISCPPAGSCNTTCNADNYACCRCVFNDNGTPENPNDDSTFPFCRCRICIQGP